MNASQFLKEIIPGYNLLTVAEKEAFETSTAGQYILQLINVGINEKFNSYWYLLFSPSKEEVAAFKILLLQETNEFVKYIPTSDDFKPIIASIDLQVLKQLFPDFALLTLPQQQLLLNTQYFAEAKTKIIELHNKMDVLTPELIKEKEQVAIVWHRNYCTDNTIKDLREKLLAKKIAILIKQWSELTLIFPLIITKLPLDELTNYLFINNNLSIVNEKLLPIIENIMRRVTSLQILQDKLNTFNQQQAQLLTELILLFLNNSSQFSADDWFGSYEKELSELIAQQTFTLHTKSNAVKSNWQFEEMLSSLSYLASTNKLTSNIKDFFDEFADAHAFIQGTSFSTQNESSFLAFVDIYNYLRLKKPVAEGKHIVFSLLTPFQALYDEYKDIAAHEKNILYKILRSLIPIVIIVAAIVIIAALFTPLLLPELAYLAVFIPSLIIGIALASLYAAVKNDIYQSLKKWYHGGAFQVPEFQVNPRMSNALGESNANTVRTFYIEQLTKCDRIECTFQQKALRTILTDQEMAQRKNNINLRHQLFLEWFDIHSNMKLSKEEVIKIIKNRFIKTTQQITDKAEQLKTQAGTEVESDIKILAAYLTFELKKQLIINPRLDLTETDQAGNAANKIVTSAPSCRFFSSFLKEKSGLETQAKPFLEVLAAI